ncbi:hypothetical protein NESM_000605400 [Novymonas esmeraldas]|uniref:Uncharacterized protein n=1 Tax=Novymonas esmeraldas TaxID=1808958 RepID=A0AAW0ER29_9TRYP
MQPRVRLLYLEFMYLVPQLDGFYSPRGAAAAATDAPTRTRRPFFLRLPHVHAACAPLRAAHVTELESYRYATRSPAGPPSQTSAEAAATAQQPATHDDAEAAVSVFRLQSAQERALVTTFMPPNWDNSDTTTTHASHVGAASSAAEYRERVQRLFYANALVPVGCAEWKRCLARGRYELRGIHNVLHVRKYRALHKRYGWASQLSRTELEAAWGGSVDEVEQALLGLSNRDVYGYTSTDSDAGGGHGAADTKE